MTSWTPKHYHDFDDDNSIEEHLSNFIEKIKQESIDVLSMFHQESQIQKPVIKIIQLCELNIFLLEKNSKKKIHNGFISSISSIFNSFIFQKFPVDKENWVLNRKLIDVQKKFLLKNDFGRPIDSFLDGLRNVLFWRKKSRAINFAIQIIEKILALGESRTDIFEESFLSGRFDKIEHHLENTVIIGDDGGLYCLMNSLTKKTEELIIDTGVITKEYLEHKIEESKENPEAGQPLNQTQSKRKLIIGKGGYGKVRLAMSLTKRGATDIGQVVCVKKSKSIYIMKNSVAEKGKKIPKAKQDDQIISEIIDATIEDYLAKNVTDLLHAPSPLDMALIINRSSVNPRHQKGYLIMEIFPQNTADKIFLNPDYQKPYALQILQASNLMLSKSIINTDLKPRKTLYNPHSRKVALIDLGGSLKIENPLEFKPSMASYKITRKFCPRELLFSTEDQLIKIEPAMVYLCGRTFREVLKNTDLNEAERNVLDRIIDDMTVEDLPEKRISIVEAIKRISVIGDDSYIKRATVEYYIQGLKKLINENPGCLGINSDILIT